MKAKQLTILFYLAISASLTISAQTQEGIVRTLERPTQTSAVLEGVIIRMQGGHNDVISSEKGLFHLPMDNKHYGDGYTLQRVKKRGYELADHGVVGRRYAYSNSVPLTIVMVSTAQLQADKQKIEFNAFQTVERNYHQQLEAMEQQLSDKTINEETYRAKLVELQQRLERYQGLVEHLADHYARTDYAFLDEKERVIALSIENGDWDFADSLLSTMFDPTGILEHYREAWADADRRLAQGQQLMDEAQEALRAFILQQEKDGERLYQLYTIALARFDNEEARHYIEIRAALDTTNVEWQCDAGLFIQQYYPQESAEALTYYHRGLRHAKTEFGENSAMTALCYNNIAGVYDNQSNTSKYKEYLLKASSILEANYGDDYYGLAALYNNLGGHHARERHYEKALDYYFKALGIIQKTYGENNPETAISYNNIGYVYASIGDDATALKYYKQALNILQNIYGEYHYPTAAIYNIIGILYSSRGDYSLALENHLNAKRILEKTVGLSHPDMALTLNNIGNVYSNQNDYSKSISHHQKALSILRKTQSEASIDIASTYSDISFVYFEQGRYEQSLNYLTKAYNIFETVLGKHHRTTRLHKFIIKRVKRAMKRK